MSGENSSLLRGDAEHPVSPSSGEQKDNAEEDPEDKKFSLHVKVTFVCMTITNFLAGCYFAIIFPFFPTLASEKQISSLQTGIVFSCFELVILIATPIWGKLIVNTGPRFMYSTGVLVCSACSVLFGVLEFSPPGAIFLVMCVLTRIMEGAAAAAFYTSSFTINCILFPDDAGVAAGVLEMSESLGFTLGPLIGGALYQGVGYMMTFVIAACPLVVAGLVGVVYMRVDHKVSGQGSSMWKFLSSPLMINISIQSVILGGMIFGFLYSTLALHLEKFSLSPVVVGAVFLSTTAGYFIFSPIFGHLGDKYPSLSLPLLAGLGIVGGFSFMLLGPAPFFSFLPRCAIWLIAISLFILGSCAAVVSVTFSQLVLLAREHGFPDDIATQGMVASTFIAFLNVGEFLGPVLGGGLYQYVGFEWGTSSFGFLCIMTSLVMVIYICWTRNSDRTCDSELSPDSESIELSECVPER